MSSPIKILASGVALGVYIPGLTLHKQLKNKGTNVEFCVLESLFIKEKRDKLLENKMAFHRNFRVALVGQKLAGDMSKLIDNILLEELLKKWDNENIRRFIIFSGYWLPVIESYIKKYNIRNIRCDLIHMDSVESSSWRNYDCFKEGFNNIWFFNYSHNKVNYFLDIGNLLPKPFSDREMKFVIHGGGWGMGTYASYIPQLIESRKRLDIIAYEYKDIEEHNDSKNYYMIDPQWKSWEKAEDDEHIFPPFGFVSKNMNPIFSHNKNFADVYNLERESLGIISKPGGGTLLDSICSATPVIFLEPFGEYEEKNSLLWQSLGYGISYEKWKDYNYSIDILKDLHQNLLDGRDKIVEFSDYYLNQLL